MSKQVMRKVEVSDFLLINKRKSLLFLFLCFFVFGVQAKNTVSNSEDAEKDTNSSIFGIVYVTEGTLVHLEKGTDSISNLTVIKLPKVQNIKTINKPRDLKLKVEKRIKSISKRAKSIKKSICEKYIAGRIFSDNFIGINVGFSNVFCLTAPTRIINCIFLIFRNIWIAFVFIVLLQLFSAYRLFFFNLHFIRIRFQRPPPIVLA